jgi:hypothetical protein
MLPEPMSAAFTFIFALLALSAAIGAVPPALR